MVTVKTTSGTQCSTQPIRCWVDLVEVGADEAAVEGCCDVVGVSFDHKAEVEDACKGVRTLGLMQNERCCGAGLSMNSKQVVSRLLQKAMGSGVISLME